jgi:inner membrane transporter RhtA
MTPPAPLLVLMSISSAQIGGALARTLFDEVGAVGAALLRLSLDALVLAVATRPSLRAWPAAAWRAAILLGVVIAGMNLTYYLALRTVPLGVVVTVTFLGPLVLSLAQTRRVPDLVWAGLAAGGVALLGLHPGSQAPLSGLLFAGAAGVCGAGYIVCGARLGALVPGTGGLAVSLSAGALLVLPFGAAGASAALAEPVLLLTAAVVAVLSSVLPYGLEITALRRLPTRVFGILISLQPAAGAIAGWLVLGQRLGTADLVAMLMVSAAGVGVTVRTPAGRP